MSVTSQLPSDVGLRPFGQSIDEASREALIGFCHTDCIMAQYRSLVDFAREFDGVLVGYGVSAQSTIDLLETYLLATSPDVADRTLIKTKFPPIVRQQIESESPTAAREYTSVNADGRSSEGTPPRATSTVVFPSDDSATPREVELEELSTPQKAMRKVSSYIFRTANTSNGGPSSPLRKAVSFQQPPRASGGPFDAAAAGARPPRDPRLTCNSWFAVLLLLRHFAVHFLREMAETHNVIVWCLRYWEWAQWNPTTHLTHVMATSAAHTFQWCTGHRARLAAERRATIQKHISRLRSAERRVVENIGRVHSALHSLTIMVKSLSSVVEQTHEIGSDESSPTSSITQLPVAAAHGTSTPVPPVDLEDELCAIATHTLHGIRLPVGCGISGEGRDTAVGHTFWGSSKDLTTLERETTTTFAPEETIVLAARMSWREALVSLRTIALSCNKWLGTVASIVHRKEFPPRGRHWPRVVKYSVVILPLLRVAWTTNLLTLPQRAAGLGLLFVDRFNAYVATPCRNFIETLTSSHPSQSYRQQLEAETSALAKMIRDYHDDVYADMSKTELEAIRRNVVDNNDLGIVTRDYLTAVRRPIRSFFMGQLVRLLLIQLQQQKIEMNRVLIASDEVLIQNDLSFKMMAMTPVVCMAVFLFWIIVLRRKTESEPVYERLRLCWRKLVRLITMVENSEALEGPGVDAANGVGGGKVGAGLRGLGRASATNLSHTDQGYVLLFVHEMRALASTLTRYTRVAELMEDLDDVESLEASKAQRLAALNRMSQVHYFLHPMAK